MNTRQEEYQELDKLDEQYKLLMEQLKNNRGDVRVCLMVLEQLGEINNKIDKIILKR